MFQIIVLSAATCQWESANSSTRTHPKDEERRDRAYRFIRVGAGDELRSPRVCYLCSHDYWTTSGTVARERYIPRSHQREDARSGLVLVSVQCWFNLRTFKEPAFPQACFPGSASSKHDNDESRLRRLLTSVALLFKTVKKLQSVSSVMKILTKVVLGSGPAKCWCCSPTSFPRASSSAVEIQKNWIKIIHSLQSSPQTALVVKGL